MERARRSKAVVNGSHTANRVWSCLAITLAIDARPPPAAPPAVVPKLALVFF